MCEVEEDTTPRNEFFVILIPIIQVKSNFLPLKS